MKRKKSLTKFTAIVLLVTMIALILISGTFAKYTTEYDGTGTAIVAKWKVDIKNPVDNSTTFDLFDKSAVYDLASVDDPDDLSTATGVVDTDVDETGDNAKVAPGTWGKVGFQITVGSDNEVTVEYGVDITSLTTTLPLKFSTDGTTWVAASDIDTSSGPYTLGTKTTVAPKTAKTDTYTLYWKWDYETGADSTAIATNDGTDTTLGTAGTATCTIEAKLGATQVD